MAHPLVSIVIPTYGRPDFLAEAIASCKTQDYAGPTEIIVVDDGSPQDIRGVVERTHPDVQYVRIENSGAAAARQAGADLAHGEYIAYNDDDDLWEPHKLSTQVAFMQAHREIDVCLHDFIKFSASQQFDHTNFADHTELWDCEHRQVSTAPPAYKWPPQSFPAGILNGGPFPPPTMLIKREFLMRIGGWNRSIRNNGEDVELGLRAGWAGCIAFIDLPMTRVRRHHGSNMSHDITRGYAIVVDNLARAAEAYPPGLKSFVQSRLGTYYARVGWMQMSMGDYAGAAEHYRQAHRRGCNGLAIWLRHLSCSLHATLKGRSLKLGQNS